MLSSRAAERLASGAHLHLSNPVDSRLRLILADGDEPWVIDFGQARVENPFPGVLELLRGDGLTVAPAPVRAEVERVDLAIRRDVVAFGGGRLRRWERGRAPATDHGLSRRFAAPPGDYDVLARVFKPGSRSQRGRRPRRLTGGGGTR